MNTHFQQAVGKAGSGGGSLVEIPGFCLAIDGNLNGQMKRPGDNALIEVKTLPLEQMQGKSSKSEEIKYDMNCTILTNVSSKSMVLPYLQRSWVQP